MTKPLSDAKLERLAHVFKAIEDARTNGRSTVYLQHSKPKSLYYDLTRARTTLYPQWKTGIVKFFVQELGIEVRISHPAKVFQIPVGEIAISPQTSYMKIGSHLLEGKPNIARFSTVDLSPEEIRKLEILGANLQMNSIHDKEAFTILFTRI